MSKIIEGLKYAESHEWVKVEDGVAVIGVTDFAQAEMGDITYVDMPDVDDEVEAGEEFGALESVKAASDLISPVSGKVVAVNEELDDAPRRSMRTPTRTGSSRSRCPIRPSWTP